MLSAVITSRRSKPAVLLAEQLAHQRSVRPGPLILGTALSKSPGRAAERDRTVSRRSKPSSRTALIGEQPNPWDLLQPQDATSRHRGAKPCRRYGLLGKITLLPPGSSSPPPPPRPASVLPRLPPILHKPSRAPMQSCSKGPGVFPSCCA